MRKTNTIVDNGYLNLYEVHSQRQWNGLNGYLTGINQNLTQPITENYIGYYYVMIERIVAKTKTFKA